jgi:lactoylglutathione lyase
MNLKINHIQHIGIPVSNMDKSITFYERLGFKNVCILLSKLKVKKEALSL